MHNNGIHTWSSSQSKTASLACYHLEQMITCGTGYWLACQLASSPLWFVLHVTACPLLVPSCVGATPWATHVH
jgi:hypothetical protein